MPKAYKSFRSLYVLCVRCHGEDAATILRRLLEVSAQIVYLDEQPGEQDVRAQHYLAYFWIQAPDRIALTTSPAEKGYWQDMYEKHSHLFHRTKKNRIIRNWWGSDSVSGLFSGIGWESVYKGNYEFLSQMSHGTPCGSLIGGDRERVDILTDRMIPHIVVWGCRFFLGALSVWNAHLHLIADDMLSDLEAAIVGFKF